MAEGTIQLPPDSTGKVTRTQTNAGVAGGAHQPVSTLALPDGTLVAAGAGSLPVDLAELPTAAALADDVANPTTTLIGAAALGFDGTAWDRRRTTTIGTTPGIAQVNLAGSAGVAAAVSATVSATAAANTTGTVNTTGLVIADVSSAGNATIILSGGTYTALTLAFEASPDASGLLWFPIDAARSDGFVVELQPSFTAAGVRAWNIMTPGYRWVRARVVAITKTVDPTITINQGPFLYDPSPSVAPIDGQKPTYSASGTSAVATAFAIGYLQGSATKTVRLISLRLTGTATAAAVVNVVIGRYSTAPTAGTSTAPAIATHDTTNPTATAVPRQYSAAPTGSGTLVAVIRTARMLLSTAATAPTIMEYTFGERPGQGIVLRGTSEFVTIVPPAAAGASWAFDFEWTEE